MLQIVEHKEEFWISCFKIIFTYESLICEIVMCNWDRSSVKLISHMKISHMKLPYVKLISHMKFSHMNCSNSTQRFHI